MRTNTQDEATTLDKKVTPKFFSRIIICLYRRRNDINRTLFWKLLFSVMSLNLTDLINKELENPEWQKDLDIQTFMTNGHIVDIEDPNNFTVETSTIPNEKTLNTSSWNQAEPMATLTNSPSTSALLKLATISALKTSKPIPIPIKDPCSQSELEKPWKTLCGDKTDQITNMPRILGPFFTSSPIEKQETSQGLLKSFSVSPIQTPVSPITISSEDSIVTSMEISQSPPEKSSPPILEYMGPKTASDAPILENTKSTDEDVVIVEDSAESSVSGAMNILSTPSRMLRTDSAMNEEINCQPTNPRQQTQITRYFFPGETQHIWTREEVVNQRPLQKAPPIKTQFQHLLQELKCVNERHYFTLLATNEKLRDLEMRLNPTHVEHIKKKMFEQMRSINFQMSYADYLLYVPLDISDRLDFKLTWIFLKSIADENNMTVDQMMLMLYNVLIANTNKKNTLMVCGASDAGKTVLFNLLLSVVPDYKIGRFRIPTSHSRNQFWLEDLPGNDFYRCDEGIIDDLLVWQDLKALFEGNNSLLANRKYLSPITVEKRPVLVSTNATDFSDLTKWIHAEAETLKNRCEILFMHKHFKFRFPNVHLGNFFNNQKEVISFIFSTLDFGDSRVENDCNDLSIVNKYISNQF